MLYGTRQQPGNGRCLAATSLWMVRKPFSLIATRHERITCTRVYHSHLTAD
jgi:hypothetical protein